LRLCVNSDEAKAFHAKARRDSEGAKKDQDATSRLLPSVFAFFLLPFAIMPLVAVIPEPNAPVELREVPSPDLENDSALFEVELSEVCGTDVYLQQGRLQGVPYPLVPGHVSVGRLSKIRGTLRDVEDREFREGDRATFLDVRPGFDGSRLQSASGFE